MSATGLESIDHTVQLTHKWINDLDARLGWEQMSRCLLNIAKRSLLRLMLSCVGLASKHAAG